MKKILALVMALLLLPAFSVSAAKQTIDLDTMSMDALIKLQSDVAKAIERKQGNSASNAAFKLTPKELLDAFENNSVAAEMKYKGQMVEVTGYIEKIDKSFWGDEVYVSLVEKKSDFNFETIDCYIQMSESSKVANLEKGKKVTMIGVCEGKSFMSIEVKECIIK